MSTRATVALVLVFAGLLTAYWVTGRIERNVIKQAAEAKKLFDFAPEDITTLSIARHGEAPVEALRKDDGQWTIAAPYPHVRPNGPVWTALTIVVASLTNEREIDAGTDALADYQLEAPVLSVIFGTKQGQLSQVAFGALDPTQVNRYARLGEGQVFLCPARFFQALNRGLQELRDTRMFAHLGEGVERIDFERHATEGADEIEDPGMAARARGIDETYVLAEDGEWRLSKPVDATASQAKLDALASWLRFATGRGYIDEPESLSDYGLDPPYAELTAYGPTGEGLTLLIGWPSGDEDKPGLFVKRADNPSVFVAEAHLVTLLPAGPGDFREGRLFTREAKNLKTIRYLDSRSEMLLENDPDEGWRLVDPPADDTDQFAVSMYIAVLKSIQGLSFPEGDEALSIESPRLSLEFTYTDGAPPSSIRIGGPVPSSNPIVFSALQDIGAATTISFDSFRNLQADSFRFRIKTLFPFRRDAVRGVDLTFDDRHYVFGYENGVWTLSEPRGARLETQSDVHSLIDTFSTTLAKGIADPPPAADVQGRNDPILTVVFEVVDDPLTDTRRTVGPVHVGNRLTSNSRQRFLWIEGKAPVYHVDQALIDGVRDALRGVVFGRSVLQ